MIMDYGVLSAEWKEYSENLPLSEDAQQKPPSPAPNKPEKGCSHKKSPTREFLWLSFILALLFIGVYIAFWFRLWVGAWIWAIAILLLFIRQLGINLLCKSWGIFINERNLMSLSRLQIVLWTIIIVSAYLVMVLARIYTRIDKPFDITMDWHLWAVLGLSLSAAVGGPLINSNKGMKQPSPPPKAIMGLSSEYSPSVRKAAAAFQQNDNDVETTRVGILYVNPDPNDARFSDIFEGDELTNTMYIDIAKVQMFWFSLIAIAGYSIFLLNLFLNSDPLAMNAFPAFSDGFIAILTVSHAGYLGGKSVTQTPSSG